MSRREEPDYPIKQIQQEVAALQIELGVHMLKDGLVELPEPVSELNHLLRDLILKAFSNTSVSRSELISLAQTVIKHIFLLNTGDGLDEVEALVQRIE